jgi:hypothetical protein
MESHADVIDENPVALNAVRRVNVIRYVTPLREGGSLPAVVEADDFGTYVLKFRGAGQGVKVLIAELLAGEIGRALGLPVPEIVFAELDPVLGRSEPDPEIQDLITSSGGLNLGIDYLPGSFAFDTQAARALDPALASAIVWFDAFITNVDRTCRNTNMLLWHRKPWLIDHGAAFFVQFGGPDFPSRAGSRFPQIRDHLLLPYASRLREADERLSGRLTPVVIDRIVALIPEVWLDDPSFPTPADQRAAYRSFIEERIRMPHAFVDEASDARARLV